MTWSGITCFESATTRWRRRRWWCTTPPTTAWCRSLFTSLLAIGHISTHPGAGQPTLGKPLWSGADLLAERPASRLWLPLLGRHSLPLPRLQSSFLLLSGRGEGGEQDGGEVDLRLHQVLFLSPAALVATSSSNSSVELSWEEPRGG